jgi:nucleotide-binding universal stress UspA family protein
MFGRILTAIDNSELAEQVFHQALSLARVTGARLLLLHALSDEEIGYPDVCDLSEHLSKWEQSKQTGLKRLRSYQTAAITAGVDAEFIQTPGASGQTICHAARSWQADLIVVGHRGLSRLDELMRGSVSNYLVHHAPCSVWTVIGQAEPVMQKIVVAIDGSSTSQHAFESALLLAKATAASLQLINVLSVEDPGSPNVLSLGSPDFERRWQAFTQPSLDNLQACQAIAKAVEVEAEIHQKLGSNAGRAICELAQRSQADLIVVGRRGLSGLNELLMGSVSNYVTHYALCSVLTVQGQSKSVSPSQKDQVANT